MARPSAFRSDEARAADCRLYDEAIALSEVPVAESDAETSFDTTRVLTAGDPAKPPLVAPHGMGTSSTTWVPLLPALTASHHVRMLDTVGDVGVAHGPIVAASTGTWLATHFAMARPDRVERLAFVCPAGIVSAQHARWLLRAVIDVSVRNTPSTIEAFFDAHAGESTRQRMRTDPWRPIMQQLITGLATFRRGVREPRPVRCNNLAARRQRYPRPRHHRLRRDPARRAEDGRAVPAAAASSASQAGR